MRIWTLIAALLLATACTAEGELEDVDAGTPDFGTTPNSANVGNSGTDAGNSGNADSGPTGNNGFEGATELCDPLAPACPEGEKCVPNPSTGQSLCVSSGTDVAIGDACSRSTDCVEGASCISDGAASTCRELCTPGEVMSCDGAETFCTQTLGSDPSLGVCAPGPESCDIYTQSCADEACVLLRNPVDDQVGTYCGDAGSVAIGQPCGNGAGSCVAGAICIQAGSDTGPTCHQVCRDPDVTCSSGACTGSSQAGVTFCI